MQNSKLLSLFISLEIVCFQSQSTVNICIAGLNRRAGYATEREVWHTLYGEPDKKGPPKYKFEIGDQVRISKMKRTFEKGYLPKFSKEIFTVSQQIPREPPVYKLKDYDQEELSGTFYNEELQKVIKEDDVYEVEKILKSRGKGKKKEVLVKWLGYPAKFNSWIPASEVKDI